MQKFDHIMIFTDGACSGNPGRGGWGVIIATPAGHVRELGGGADATTNNRMEMVAALRGIEALKDQPGNIGVYADSVYVMRGITQWIFGWRRNGWRNSAGEDVANKDLWILLDQAVSARPKNSISWYFVRGHSKIPGNDRVDEIAVDYSKGRHPDLYDGPLLKYGVAIHDLPEDLSLPEMKSRDKEKKAAYSYVSVVDGKPQRHSTWPDCERRVKGRSGAKFKKTTDANNEAEVLASWGVDPQSF